MNEAAEEEGGHAQQREKKEFCEQTTQHHHLGRKYESSLKLFNNQSPFFFL